MDLDSDIDPIFHDDLRHLSRLIIVDHDPDWIFFMELEILLEVDRLFSWIPDEKSWSISTITNSKYLF